MAKKRHYEQALEARDSHMLSADMSACANMPQTVKYHAWPTSGAMMDYSLNDDIGGIDAQMRSDVSGAKRQKSKNKY